MSAADQMASTGAERACLDRLRELCGEADGPMERHSVRVFLLARMLAEKGGHDADLELMLCASLLHDLGLYPGASTTSAPYVTDGRRLAEEVLGAAGWAPGRVALCGQAVERHHELTPQWSRGTEVELVRRADLVEVSHHLISFGLSREQRRETLRTARREGFVREVARGLARAARERPGSLWRIFHPGEHGRPRRHTEGMTQTDDGGRYAVQNLMEIDDATGDREGIEGRFARKLIGSRELGVSHFRFAPGYRATTGHRHREQEEAYVVVSGSARMRLDDDVIELRQWDVVRVAPEVARGFHAGPEGLDVIAIGGTKPEGGDGEVVEDFWVED